LSFVWFHGQFSVKTSFPFLSPDFKLSLVSPANLRFSFPWWGAVTVVFRHVADLPHSLRRKPALLSPHPPPPGCSPVFFCCKGNPIPLTRCFHPYLNYGGRFTCFVNRSYTLFRFSFFIFLLSHAFPWLGRKPPSATIACRFSGPLVSPRWSNPATPPPLHLGDLHPHSIAGPGRVFTLSDVVNASHPFSALRSNLHCRPFMRMLSQSA